MDRRLGPQARHVYSQLRRRILSGDLPPGSKLPPQAELARQYGVALLTTRQAVIRLEDEGLLSCVHGKGTFVSGAHDHAPSPLSSEEQYRSLIEALPGCVAITDLDGTVVRVNQIGAEMFGYAQPEEMAGISLPDSVTPEDRPQARQALEERRTLRVPRGRTAEYRLRRLDGSSFPAAVSSSILLDDRGKPAGLTVLIQDITERKRAEEAARASDKRYRRLVELSPGPMAVAADGRIVYANRSALDALGAWDLEELAAKHIMDFVHPDYRALAAARGQRVASTREIADVAEQKFIRLDGHAIDVEVVSIPITWDGQPAIQVVFRDITEQKRFEDQLQHQALHDPLTDLPNRALLHDRLQHALAAAQRYGHPLALLLMDLDHFKEINDTFGHHYGDLLLKDVAGRLGDALRAADTVARLGGDEFAILLEETDEPSAKAVTGRILDAVAQPYVVEGYIFDVKASIGMAFYPEHGEDPDTLLRRADVAMYLAKRSGTGCSRYDVTQDQYSPERLILLAGLREAIRKDQLTLHYQPKLDLKSDHIHEVEALVRWVHPERGFIPPEQFIGLAEHSGLIKPLTYWVVDHALRQCRAWHDMGLDLTVAVNLSARNLHDPDMVESIAHLLRESGAEGSWLKLEVTESAIMADAQGAADTLTRLRRLGVTSSIDDFGTGYSSLAYLKRFPVDEIKVDRSFVSEMATNEDDAFIVHAILDMGQNLGLRIVAEGVEDQQTLARLRTMGCDLVQGYYLSRPLPADSLCEWLQEDGRLVPSPPATRSA